MTSNNINFTKQNKRIDVLKNIINNSLLIKQKTLTSLELLNIILTDNNTNTKHISRIGFLFEVICIILLSSKCLLKINYKRIYQGQLTSLKKLKNIKYLLNCPINQGDNPSDFTYKLNDYYVAMSIKYNNTTAFNPDNSDVLKLNTEMKSKYDKYKVGLIVKDKTIVENHIYTNKALERTIVHKQLIKDNLLLDKKDIILGLQVFCNRFNNQIKILDFIELINKDYLNSPRQQLRLKLHQQITYLNFINNSSSNLHLVSHKPRSGKSITLLMISKYLLNNGYNKILIMTSIPDTIKNFIEDLDTYIDFKHILYINQNEFKTIDESFVGIVFCSVQYLKTDSKLTFDANKKQCLKNINFDAMIIDECHLGSSTKKTDNDILNISNNNNNNNNESSNDIDDIRSNIKMNIFASGTSDKTKRFYNIKNVYHWETVDEGFVKELNNNDTSIERKDELFKIMQERHGNCFEDCYNDNTLYKDYTKCPTQVLMKKSLPNIIIKQIEKYNIKNKTKYGYSASSLLALNKVKGKSKKIKYENKFELENSSDGNELLCAFFNNIISNDRMNKNTIMKSIEKTQSIYKSRISKKGIPKLFLLYLPTHTGNNNIKQLQETFKRFIEDNELWSEYNIEYSNATSDTAEHKTDYNEYIDTIINKSKKYKKKGCILLLGNKGGVGITYHNCDVTISLDDGHNLDNQKQRYSRALTEADNKTIGINVDMNIQRTYLYINDFLLKYKNITKTRMNNGDILTYLHENQIFLFNPDEIYNGEIKTHEISSYYNKEAKNIINNIDHSKILNEIIICDEDIEIDASNHYEINWDTSGNIEIKEVNTVLEGEQQDCPKGNDMKINKNISSDDEEDEKEDDKEDEKDEEEKKLNYKKFIKEICSTLLFPLLSLLSRSNTDLSFNDMMEDNRPTKTIISSIFRERKIILNKNLINTLKNTMNKNKEIINNIQEIYRNTSPENIHKLIAKHFIPTLEQKKNNAEVPTPISLVIKMLDKVPLKFWTKVRKVFEPCCGKGNFIMKIFEKFYVGLEQLYPDELERCKIIITECIYFADITECNVFITKEILKCEIQHKTGIEVIDYEFNSYIGDTLQLNIKDKWNINGFNAVIGNPPYNSSGNTGTGNTIWQDFTKISLNYLLNNNGYLVFVHPPGWRKPNTKRGKFFGLYELMTKKNQMIYLSIHGIEDGQQTFKCGTRYDWYLIQKKNKYKTTVVNDENRKTIVIDMNKFIWVPNYNIEKIQKILANKDDKKCEIIYSPSAYEHRKKWMSKIKNDNFKYTCIHSTPKNGVRYMYSKVNDRGHFGVPKIIFGETGIYNSIIDINGDYGLTNGCIGIKIEDIQTGNNYKRILESDGFKDIIKSCSFSSFRVDWNIFKNFKKDFWKEFIINTPIDNTSINNIFINNEFSIYKIIKDGRKNYYLINTKLYKVKRDKSKGIYVGTYINGKIILK